MLTPSTGRSIPLDDSRMERFGRASFGSSQRTWLRPALPSSEPPPLQRRPRQDNSHHNNFEQRRK
jgi:hypothetical protein